MLRNKDVGDVCYALRSEGASSQRIAEELVRMSLQRGSMDNVTCMVLSLAGYLAHVGTMTDDIQDEKDSASPLPLQTNNSFSALVSSDSPKFANQIPGPDYLSLLGKPSSALTYSLLQGHDVRGRSSASSPNLHLLSAVGGLQSKNQSQSQQWGVGASEAQAQANFSSLKSVTPYSGFAQPRAATAKAQFGSEYGDKRPSTVGSAASAGHGRAGVRAVAASAQKDSNSLAIDYDQLPLSRSMPANAPLLGSGQVSVRRTHDSATREAGGYSGIGSRGRRDLANPPSNLSQSLYIGRASSSYRAQRTPASPNVSLSYANTTQPQQLFSRTNRNQSY